MSLFQYYVLSFMNNNDWTWIVTMYLHMALHLQFLHRYNLYDRSSRVPQPESATAMFYRALRCLSSAVRRPEAVWWLTLQPGTVVFVNNWRVLHGRSAYMGRRTMTGAYITMSSLLSRARGLKLIR